MKRNVFFAIILFVVNAMFVQAIDLSGVWYREDYEWSLRDNYTYYLSNSWDDAVTATSLGSELFSGTLVIVDEETVVISNSNDNNDVKLKKYDFSGEWIKKEEYHEVKNSNHAFYVTKIQSKQATVSDGKISLTEDFHLFSINLIKVGENEYVRKSAIYYDIQEYEHNIAGIWYLETPEKSIGNVYSIAFYLHCNKDKNSYYYLTQTAKPFAYEDFKDNALMKQWTDSKYSWQKGELRYELLDSGIMEVHKVETRYKTTKIINRYGNEENVSKKISYDCGCYYLKRYDFSGEWLNYSEYKASKNAEKVYSITHFRQNENNICDVNNTIEFYDEQNIIDNLRFVSIIDNEDNEYCGKVTLVNENVINVEGIDYIRKSYIVPQKMINDKKK